MHSTFLRVTLLALFGITTTLHAQDQYFTDVPVGSQYYNATAAMLGLNITTGVPGGGFAPDVYLLRREMAVFIIRAWSVRLWNDPEAFQTNAPPSSTSYFTDVSQDSYFPYIQKMYELGITTGCASNPTRFCPAETLANYQIAVFTDRARKLSDNYCTSPVPPSCNVDAWAYTTSPAFFNDVPIGYGTFPWIQRAADLGTVSNQIVTTGCTMNNFCPNLETPRGQMAIYVISSIVTWAYWQSHGRFTTESGS